MKKLLWLLLLAAGCMQPQAPKQAGRAEHEAEVNRLKAELAEERWQRPLTEVKTDSLK